MLIVVRSGSQKSSQNLLGSLQQDVLQSESLSYSVKTLRAKIPLVTSHVRSVDKFFDELY